MNSYPRLKRIAFAVTLSLLPTAGAVAQTTEDKGGFAIRQVNVSTGYGFVQLPATTLGGYVPTDVLNADLITTAAADVEWRRIARQSTYRLGLFGTYTGRTRYSQLNAPGAELTFGVAHVPSLRWRLSADLATTLTNSDQLASQPTQARRLVDDAVSFGDLAGAVALARPAPDLAETALFVPISQSLAGADVYGTRFLASTARAEAIYLNSARLSTHFRGSYTAVRPVFRTNEAERGVLFPNSQMARAGVGLRHDRSERTQLTAAVDWSQTEGVSEDKAFLVTLGYGWMGRKWFTMITGGAALRPLFQSSANSPSSTPAPRRTAALIATAALGYKYRAHTVLVQYTHAPHDEYGYGGRNVATGFEGSVQSAVGSWSWSLPRSQWIARSDVTLVRRPGNFSYINAWLATVGVGRQLGPNLRVFGEILFDRHGSRGFEGSHLTRQGARINLVWNPSRRRAAPTESDR